MWRWWNIGLPSNYLLNLRVLRQRIVNEQGLAKIIWETLGAICKIYYFYKYISLKNHWDLIFYQKPKLEEKIWKNTKRQNKRQKQSLHLNEWLNKDPHKPIMSSLQISSSIENLLFASEMVHSQVEPHILLCKGTTTKLLVHQKPSSVWTQALHLHHKKVTTSTHKNLHH